MIVVELQMGQRANEQQIAAVAAYYQEVRSSNGVATTK
jgi:cytochrome c553